MTPGPEDRPGQPAVPSTGDEAEEWHRIAEQRRRQLERLQDQTLYHVAARALARGRRLADLSRGTFEPLRRTSIRIVRSVPAVPSRLRASARELELRTAVNALPPAPDGARRRDEVTAVIVTAAQPRRLETLLTALDRIGVRALVVDNAGVLENASVIARHPNARRLPLTVPRNYAEANELAIAEVATPWLLLLNDDIAPLDDHWLDRMLVAADDATVAVGAQLVHGRRGLLGGEAVDGRVQHAGIGLVLDGPLVRPEHLARGTRPDVRDEVRTVPAATAACLLVRADAHRAIGGLHAGFDYGSEDVDLCLRLAQHGEIRVALGAVLSHEEGATRLRDRRAGDRRARTLRQAANRALLDARHAPALRRRVVEATLPDEARDEVPDAARLVVSVLGTPPSQLLRALREDRGVRVVPRPAEHRRDPRGRSGRRAPGALAVIVDPRSTPERSGGVGEVPVLGWIEAQRGATGWSEAALARLDAVVIVATDAGDVMADRTIGRLRELDPTLPVHRADTSEDVRAVVRSLLLAPRWMLRIGAPGGRGAERWGDVPVAEALARELRAHGLVVRTVGRDGWGGRVDRTADVTVHLKGRGVAPTAQTQANIVWVMSHPSEVAPGELDAADLVLAGSELLAARYRSRTHTPVAVMPQATDARRFTPGPVEPERSSRVLFVGNTRSVPRPSVLGAVDAGLPLTLIGGGWERFVDPALVRLPSVPNAALPGWYRSAEVVLNDHWDDMARWGLVSNRVFDVLACGGCVVSDQVPGMDALLDDAVVTFTGRDEVGPTVRTLLSDPEQRAERAERGRRAVLAAHTWEIRASELVELVSAHTRSAR